MACVLCLLHLGRNCDLVSCPFQIAMSHGLVTKEQLFLLTEKHGDRVLDDAFTGVADESKEAFLSSLFDDIVCRQSNPMRGYMGIYEDLFRNEDHLRTRLQEVNAEMQDMKADTKKVVSETSRRERYRQTALAVVLEKHQELHKLKGDDDDDDD
ncbi:hypothetical protein Hanom_Chr15g01398131 [Helianthus anomalus]